MARLSNVTRTLAVLAVVCSAAAQTPPFGNIPPPGNIKVGEINFYGLHKISAARILSAVNLKPGAPLPPSKGELEDAIEKIPGVVFARVEAVCCEGSQATLFIGIEEKGAPHAAFHSEPAGAATLPPDLIDSFGRFVAAVQRAARQGNAAEDLTAGHSRMADPEARAFQDQFIAFAAGHLEQLRNVLRSAAEPEQRAIAAAAIGYAADKKTILNDLQFAMQDPDESVRANAVRSLVAVAVLASQQPDLGIRIAPTWFVELLNSAVLSDRVESAKALLTLTDRESPAVLQLVRERALPALAEMARWKTPRYALPSFLLLGRVAGLSEDQVRQFWEKEDRESVIGKALNPAGAKR
jgi:hypothetical protein